jgi:hypothetical protein
MASEAGTTSHVYACPILGHTALLCFAQFDLLGSI